MSAAMLSHLLCNGVRMLCPGGQAGLQPSCAPGRHAPPASSVHPSVFSTVTCPAAGKAPCVQATGRMLEECPSFLLAPASHQLVCCALGFSYVCTNMHATSRAEPHRFSSGLFWPCPLGVGNQARCGRVLVSAPCSRAEPAVERAAAAAAQRPLRPTRPPAKLSTALQVHLDGEPRWQ